MNIQFCSKLNSCNRSNYASNKTNRYNVSFSGIEEDTFDKVNIDDEYVANLKKNQAYQREKAILLRRFYAFLSALGITAGITAGTIVSSNNGSSDANSTKPDSSYVSTPSKDDESFEDPTQVSTSTSVDETKPYYTEPIIDDDSTIATLPTVEIVPDVTEPEIKEPIETEPVDDLSVRVQEIFESHPEVKEQYDNIKSALNTFSEHLGKDGLSVILSSIEKNGNGIVDPMDALKILYIESSGRVYDKNGKYLVNGVGAMGPFQIKKIVEKDINRVYGYNGTDKEIDISKPYDNIDGFVLWWRFIMENRLDKTEIPSSFPEHRNEKSVAAWLYNQSAYADTIGREARSYVAKFDELSVLDDYPEVVEYILNGG